MIVHHVNPWREYAGLIALLVLVALAWAGWLLLPRHQGRVIGEQAGLRGPVHHMANVGYAEAPPQWVDGAQITTGKNNTFIGYDAGRGLDIGNSVACFGSACPVVHDTCMGDCLLPDGSHALSGRKGTDH